MASAMLVNACNDFYICPDPLFPGVAVRLQDAFGRPAAFGATLVAIDGAFVDSSTYTEDGLWLGAANNRAGTYTLKITRPWYDRVLIPDVEVPGGECGAYRTVTVSRTLHLVPRAPAVRNIVITTWGNNGLGLYFAHVDADPGVDTTVTWSISDTTVAAIRPSGLLVSQCWTRGGEATLVATATADTTVKGEYHVWVEANAQSCP